MAEEQTYAVARHHLGDRLYAPGDERTADPQTVKHLVEKGVLVARTKAEPAPKNKAAQKPKNKAEGNAGDA